MEYTALYRQWRPDTFDEVVGQDATIRILKNQIKLNRIGHAYLFCGSRGTGKTSTAKVFAKAVNCLEPVDGNPCLKCDVCQKLSTGSSMDIIEIDAASNNGVDEIRELRDKVKYPPVVGRYKVYIIDEVHMLSTGAFNALLKTLEEPPRHIIFILATTEPHRLPATILSRCQRYNFKRISNRAIVDRLDEVATQMGVQIEREALNTVARWAEGSMRDALSLLDQCIGFCGNVLTNANVLTVLGTADQDFIFAVADNIIEGNLPGLFYQVEHIINDGRDVAVFLRDLIHHLRNLLIMKVCREPAEILDVSEDALKAYGQQAQKATQERLMRAVEVLCDLEAGIKWSTQPRVLLEVALARICRPDQEETLDALTDRVAELEKRLNDGVVVKQTLSLSEDPGANFAVSSAVKRQPKSKVSTDGDKVKVKDKNDNEKKQKAVDDRIWAETLGIIKKERIALYGLIKDCGFEIDEKGTVILSFAADQQFFIESVSKEDNRTFVEKAVERVSGRQARVRCVVTKEESVKPKIDDKLQNEDIIEKAIDLFGQDFVEVVDD